jgi:hypothetical protein
MRLLFFRLAIFRSLLRAFGVHEAFSTARQAMPVKREQQAMPKPLD